MKNEVNKKNELIFNKDTLEIKVKNKKTLKRWLDENKIYLKAISSIGAICIVIMTIANLYIAYSVYKITESKTVLDFELIKPVINIETKLFDDKEIVKEINIYNNGMSINNFEVKILPFFIAKTGILKINDSNTSMSLQSTNDRIIIPIEQPPHIFETTKYTQKTGLIAKIDASKIRKIIKISDLLLETQLDNKVDSSLVILDLNLVFFISIDYYDIAKNKLNDTYCCDTNIIHAFPLYFPDWRLDNHYDYKASLKSRTFSVNEDFYILKQYNNIIARNYYVKYKSPFINWDSEVFTNEYVIFGEGNPVKSLKHTIQSAYKEEQIFRMH